MHLAPIRLPPWPAVLAMALALAWPLTVQAIHPAVLPAGLAMIALAIVSLRRLEVGIAIVLALVPLTNASLGPLADAGLPASPEPLLIGLSGGLLVAAYLRPDTRERRHGLPVALLAFVIVSLASALVSLEPHESVGGLVRLLQAVALLLATRRVCHERQQVIVVLAGALVGLVLAAGQGVVQTVAGGDDLYGFATGDGIVERVQGSFFHPNGFALYIATLLPLAAVLVFSPSASRRLRTLAGVALAVATPALVLSYSRGAMLGLVLGGLAWLAIVRPRRVLQVGGVVALLAVVVAPGALVARFDAGRADSDASERVVLWSSALDLAGQRPVLGVGVGNFSEGYAGVRSESTTGTDRPLLNQGDGETLPFHPHNAFLTVLAEQGGAGLVAFLGLGLVAFAAAAANARAGDPLRRAAGLAVGAGLATFVVDQLVNSNLYQPSVLALFALVGLTDALRASAPEP